MHNIRGGGEPCCTQGTTDITTWQHIYFLLDGTLRHIWDKFIIHMQLVWIVMHMYEIETWVSGYAYTSDHAYAWNCNLKQSHVLHKAKQKIGMFPVAPMHCILGITFARSFF